MLQTAEAVSGASALPRASDLQEPGGRLLGALYSLLGQVQIYMASSQTVLQAAEDASGGIALFEDRAATSPAQDGRLLGELYSLQGQALLAEPGHSRRDPVAAVQVSAC